MWRATPGGVGRHARLAHQGCVQHAAVVCVHVFKSTAGNRLAKSPSPCSGLPRHGRSTAARQAVGRAQGPPKRPPPAPLCLPQVCVHTHPGARRVGRRFRGLPPPQAAQRQLAAAGAGLGVPGEGPAGQVGPACGRRHARLRHARVFKELRHAAGEAWAQGSQGLALRCEVPLCAARQLPLLCPRQVALMAAPPCAAVDQSIDRSINHAFSLCCSTST